MAKVTTRWKDERARLHTPETTAYHEAGHVVILCEFGWWVSRGGVRIGAAAYTNWQFYESDYTEVARVCVSMAGLLAEQKFHGVQWRFEEDVVEHVRAVRAGEDEGVGLFPSDLRAIALALLDDDPCISLNGVRRAVAYYRNVTNALLDEPRVWGGVERVAKALICRRHLSPRAVKQALGDAFFVGLHASKREREAKITMEMSMALTSDNVRRWSTAQIKRALIATGQQQDELWREEKILIEAEDPPRLNALIANEQQRDELQQKLEILMAEHQRRMSAMRKRANGQT